MFSFGFGMISIVGVVIFPILYLVGRLLTAGGAWLEGNEGPKDRVKAKVILFAIIGFLIGCFAQPKWEQLSSCHEETESWGKCVISMGNYRWASLYLRTR